MSTQERYTKGQLFSRLRCIIVDDNKTVRGGLKQILMTLGLKPDILLEAQSFAVANRMLSNPLDFDIVFCDISLGDGVGMDLLRNITSSPDSTSKLTPSFIFISSDVSSEHLKQFLELGVKDVLLKPLSAHSVESALNRQLPKIIEKMVSQKKS